VKTDVDPSIRLAHASDLPSVEKIIQEAYSPYIAIIGKRPAPMLDDYVALIEGGNVHVAIIADRIEGLIVLDFSHDQALIENLAIAPASQGKGLGKMLVAFAEHLALERGYEHLKLYTNALMHANIAIYTHLGFEHTHRATEDGFDRIYMQKKLEA
jgi:GNAT superfamily N-acetyltransferase